MSLLTVIGTQLTLLIAEETADDIRLSELDDIHIPVTAEPNKAATSPSLDHPREKDADEDAPAAIISDDEDDDPISIREDEAQPSDIAHQVNTMFNQGFDYDDELVAIVQLGLSEYRGAQPPSTTFCC